jgi:hypothetical protein
MVNQISVPFKNTDNNTGLMEHIGQITCHRDKLVIEFEKKDAILGVYHTAIETVEVPLGMVLSLELKKGWFVTRLTLAARQIKAIEDLPGRDGRDWTVTIRKKDREAAADLVSVANMQLSELRLKMLDTPFGEEEEEGY